MLLDISVHYPLLARYFLDFGEENLLFAVVMATKIDRVNDGRLLSSEDLLNPFLLEQ
jgi:hypothetical protein